MSGPVILTVTRDVAARDADATLTLTHPEWADYADRTRQGWTMILGSFARILETHDG